MKRIRACVCGLILTWLVVLASGQQITGNIRGTVQDPSGAVVQSAQVTAQQVETGFTRSTVTDRTGSYLLLGRSFA